MWGQAGEESIRLTERDTCSNIWGIEDAGAEAGPSNLPTARVPPNPEKHKVPFPPRWCYGKTAGDLTCGPLGREIQKQLNFYEEC